MLLSCNFLSYYKKNRKNFLESEVFLELCMNFSCNKENCIGNKMIYFTRIYLKTWHQNFYCGQQLDGAAVLFPPHSY